MVRLIRKLNRIGNKIDLTIHDEDWRTIGHFKFNQSEFPQVCKILKAKYGIEYKPSIPFNERVNSFVPKNQDSFNSKVVNKEITEDKPKIEDVDWLGGKDNNSKSPNWLDI